MSSDSSSRRLWPGSYRFTATLGLLSYATFVVYQSLADGGAWACSGPLLTTSARLSRSDALANVVAYVPLGLLLVLATTRAREAALAGGVAPARRSRSYLFQVLIAAAGSIAAVALMSASLEIVQACQTQRTSSAYDLLANALGGAIGAVGGLGLRASAGDAGSRGGLVAAHDARLRLLTAMVTVMWVVSQTMPWVFAVDVGTVRSNLSFLPHWSEGPPLDVWRVLRHAGAWVAIACTCRIGTRRASTAVAAFALAGGASLTLQLFLQARAPLSVEELTGMAVALLVVPSMVLAGAQPRPRRWAGGLRVAALVTVAAYELRPEPGVATQAFSLWPLVGLGGLLGAIDYALLFGWFGLAVVVASQWAAANGDRRARRAWPAAAVVATLVFEIMQTRIAGRGPDVSAPLFTMLAVVGAIAVLRDGR